MERFFTIFRYPEFDCVPWPILHRPISTLRRPISILHRLAPVVYRLAPVDAALSPFLCLCVTRTSDRRRSGEVTADCERAR